MSTNRRTSTRLKKKPINYLNIPSDLSNLDDENEFIENIVYKESNSKVKNAKVPVSLLQQTPKRRQSRSKRKSKISGDASDLNEDDSDGGASGSSQTQSTPPKQRKEESKEAKTSILFSPSRLIGRLSIEDHDDDGDDVRVLKEDGELKLQPRDKYQSAKISLACTETNNLPGRENEIKQLYDFILDHLHNSKSGSLYVSGQPGTGKTASLSSILKDENLCKKFTKLYINCTSISTIGSIYKKICIELNLKVNGKTEKDHLNAIEHFLSGNHKMVLMVLDEIDQLVGKKQSVLYTIFELPSRPNSKIIIIGIANSLDLTDRLLTRLNTKCDLKPKLLHFQPYTKQQIIDIFKSRLENAGVSDIFPVVTMQLLAAKVAAVSGDVRRALDIGRRVIEIAEQQRQNKNHKNDLFNRCITELKITDGVRPLNDTNEINHQKEDEQKTTIEPIQPKQVIDVLSNVYGTSQKLYDDIEDGFPLQQKILICTLMLILRKSKNKDITIGRLHDVYRRVCDKRNILAVDQAEFVGICSLVETRGIIRIAKKKESRLNKIFLQWDDEEVMAALKDKQLISAILEDISCLANLQSRN